MKASLDTNVIIHLYRANKQELLFSLFSDGIFIHEFILNIELNNHGKDIIDTLNKDIADKRITIVTDSQLKETGLYKLYKEYYDEESLLYSVSDRGEVCAIALARTIGAVTVVTDDIKERGPHFSLMRFPDSDVIPFAFYELIILLYLRNDLSEKEALDTFNEVKKYSPDIVWNFKSRLALFVKRFIAEPFTEREKNWFSEYFTGNISACLKKISVFNSYLKVNE